MGNLGYVPPCAPQRRRGPRASIRMRGHELPAATRPSRPDASGGGLQHVQYVCTCKSSSVTSYLSSASASAPPALSLRMVVVVASGRVLVVLEMLGHV